MKARLRSISRGMLNVFGVRGHLERHSLAWVVIGQTNKCGMSELGHYRLCSFLPLLLDSTCPLLRPAQCNTQDNTTPETNAQSKILLNKSGTHEKIIFAKKI